MKNINWVNLIHNLISCIIAYPFFILLFIILSPFNVILWIMWLIELIVCLFRYIFTSDSQFKNTSLYWMLFENDENFITRCSDVFLISFIVFDLVDIFNKTLKKIKKS